MEPQNHKTIAALQSDPKFAGQIVRRIAELERDYHIASGVLSERLMREAVQVMAKLAGDAWLLFEAGWSAMIVAPEWKMARGVGTGDAWLELTEITTDEDRDYSWIAAATRAGNTQFCLELVFRKGLADAAQATVGNAGAVAALTKLGFKRDDANERLFVPIEIPPQLLAMGFEQNDLAEALAPVQRAVELAIKAKGELDKLIEQVREAGKRK